MLPCGCCGKCGCEAGEMPFTMTAKFSGIGSLVYNSGAFASPEFYIPEIRICSELGSGASAVAEVVPQRVQPQLWMTASRADPFNQFEPAILSPTLTEAQENDGDKYWYVSSIAVSSPGTGYGITGAPVIITGGAYTPLPDSKFSATVSGVTAEGGVAALAIQDGGKFYALGDREIREAKLIRGGCGYAVYGRSAPTLTPLAPGGDGKAELGVTLQDFTDCNGLSKWVVSSVSVAGGSGYDSITPVTFRVGAEDTCEKTASAYIYTEPPTEPTITLVPPTGGTGAEFTPTFGPTAWGAASVSVSSATSPCVHGMPVEFYGWGVGSNQGGLVGVREPSAHAISGLKAPEVTPLMSACSATLTAQECEEEGTSSILPTLSVSVSEQSYDDGAPYYLVDKIDVEEGGRFIFSGGDVVMEYGKSLSGPLRIGVVTAVNEETGAVETVKACSDEPFHSAAGVSSTLVTDRGMVWNGPSWAPTEPSLTALIRDPQAPMPGFFNFASCSCSLSVSTATTAWGILGVAVNAGGTGYSYGQSLYAEAGEGDKVHQPFQATVKTKTEPPEVSFAFSSKNGEGAVLQASFIKDGEWYTFQSFPTLTAAGSKYEVGDKATLTVMAGSSDQSLPLSTTIVVDSVDSQGGIQTLIGSAGGRGRKDTGVIDSVVISHCGRYYHDYGTPAGVFVQHRGSYYKIDKTAEPAVSPVFSILRRNYDDFYPQCHGDVDTIPDFYSLQPVVKAVVDGDKGSEDFGQISSITVSKKGKNIAAGSGFAGGSGFDQLNDREIVLRASDSVRLVHLAIKSNYGDNACIEVDTSPGGADYTGEPTGIKAVTVTDGGYEYARYGRVEPSLSPAFDQETDAASQYAWSSNNAITFTLKQTTDSLGLDCWSLDTVEVQSESNGPAGSIAVTFSGQVELEMPWSPNGYAPSTHVPASVTISRSEAGEPATATINNAGIYYQESYDATAYTANATVSVIQPKCGDGEGAEFSVTIGSDPYDASTFGRVTAVEVTNPGSKYELLGGSANCTYMNACAGIYPTIILIAGEQSSEISIRGTTYPTPFSENNYGLVMRADKATDDCYATNIKATAIAGGTGTAEFKRGGKWVCGACTLPDQSELSATAGVTVTTQIGECGNLLVGGEPCVAAVFSAAGICLVYDGTIDNAAGRTRLLTATGIADSPPQYDKDNNCTICPTVTVSVYCSGDQVKAVVTASSQCIYCTPVEYDPASGNFGQTYDKRSLSLVSEHDIDVSAGFPQSVSWTQEFSVVPPVPGGPEPSKHAITATITFGGDCEEENQFP